MKLPFLLSLTLLLCGCVVGPRFSTPQVSSPANFAASPSAASVVRQERIDVTWWHNFGDPELDTLMDRYAHQNLDLKTAAEHVEQARAVVQLARADAFPSAAANEKYVRQRMSPNGFISLVQPSADAPLEYNQYLPSISVSWDADLFGKVHRAIEAAMADAEAAEEMRHGVTLAGAADLVETYVRLRLAQAEERILRENVATADRRMALINERLAAGAATTLEVAQAASQLAQIKQGLPKVLEQENAQSNAIALLLAESPRALAAMLAPTPAAQPAIPSTVSIGLPSELVLRRPDVRAAMASLHAATARTGVAVASFYPDLTLGGSFGFDSLHTDSLFDWASRTFMISPSLSIPLFQGGRLNGMLKLRESQQREAAIAFDRAVLQAWHDVDDALSAYAHAQEAQAATSAALAADTRASLAAQQQFDAGATGYLNVVSAQTLLLGSEDRLAGSNATAALALVGLYRALGGGWEGLDWSGSVPTQGAVQSTHSGQ